MAYIEFDKVDKIYQMGEVEIKALDKATFSIEKGELVVYTYKTGYSNYGGETEGYNKFCNSLKSAANSDKVKNHKDTVSMNVTCNSENNYQAFVETKYDVVKLKGVTDYDVINNYMNTYTNEDGTFAKDKWKKTFFQSNNTGNYSCNF